ncbi:sensor histidine kinase [Hyphomonas pacifica]|uniref:histidine kinase n=1 Tax=Hyphomonas pacifica TaxID=1280941 RepID=A0A062TP86_9PROT|nr:ATP-binding protein [Hyphomonas pacifica]KCZ47522.1 hypothetical protein HY2_16495 [Hyphomonas pacifica]RAN31391.1 hypothetical protein HY3_16870 [Hyphomonas pacifica]
MAGEETGSIGVGRSGKIYSTPLGRLVTTFILAATLFLAMGLVALQPASGWSWSIADWRSPAQTDPAIWSSLLTGLMAFIVAAWVWALKPANFAAALFALSGLATLIFCFFSFPTSLALPLREEVISWFWILNMLGASAFGIIMICLFLIYPTPVPKWRGLALIVVLGFGVWTVLRTFGPWQKFAEVQTITTVEMMVIVITVIWQVRVSSIDPRQKAIANWLGASTLVGAGAFIGTVALPITFGSLPLVRENYAFGFFLIIYGGLALGLMRYRLFDMGIWAYRLVFYAIGALLLIVLDLLLITLLAVGRAQAVGLSLLLVGFAYLPLREQLWRRLASGRERNDELLFLQVLDVSFRSNSTDRAEAWVNLLRGHFSPLEVVSGSDSTMEPEIEDEGLALTIPAVGDMPALTLKYNNHGRSLFSTKDLVSVRHLVLLAVQVLESRTAYDRGVSAERIRIARDLHDNIGAQLMRALHSDAPDKKDSRIRETLADLRDVINHAHEAAIPLDEMFADLRAETAERLDPHGVSLVWTLEARQETRLVPANIHALRSVIREAASNTIKHANATCLKVEARVTQHNVRVEIEDDGQGFDVLAVDRGQGLENMRARVCGSGGDFLIQTSEAGGARLIATFPLQRYEQ